MRKAFLAIVLVAAAFAGGALTNGPGLSWAKHLLHQFRPREPGIVAVPEGTLAGPKATDGPPNEPIPAAPVPPLVVGPVPEEPPSKAQGQAPAQGSPPAVASAPTAATPVASPNDQPLHPADGAMPAPATPAENAAESPGPRSSIQETPAPLPSPPRSSAQLSAKDQGWGDAPGSAPASVAPAGAKVDSTVAPASTTPGPGAAEASGASEAPSRSQAWSDLRRRMKELGVARYWVEGEPAGAVRFRCVIPLAGRRAVSQHFEAEGDDDLQAADAALRRVALWRATETP